MDAQGENGCRSHHQLDLRLLRFNASPHREEPVMLAQDLLSARRAVDALEVVEVAMERDPEDGDLLLTLGVALLESDELGWAGRVLTRAVATDPEWPEPWRWLGETLLRGGDVARGTRALEKARDLGCTDDAVGKLLKRTARRDELSARVGRFLSRPELVDPALLLQDLIDDERYDDAMSVLEVALAEDDEDPDLLLLRSRVERARGQYEEARASLRRATELDPSWDEAWRDLEELLVEAGDDEGARETAMAAREAERTAMEEALAERVARERALVAARKKAAAAQKAEREALAQAATEARAEADREAVAARDATEREAEAAREFAEAQARESQGKLARAAAEAKRRGEDAAKAALLRATADAKAAVQRRLEAEAAARRAEEERRIAAEAATRRAIEEKERARLDAFERAFEDARQKAQERAARAKAEAEARADAERLVAETRRRRDEERAELEEGIRRAREAAWEQARLEAQRRIESAETPAAEDVETAAFARAKTELEAHARREARRQWEDQRLMVDAARKAAEEQREREEALAKAKQAAVTQARWEATASSREAAGKRALALAAKIASDARRRTPVNQAAPVVVCEQERLSVAVSKVQPVADAAQEPVFELVHPKPYETSPTSAKANESDVDSMLDELLAALAEDGIPANDTLPGIPAPGVGESDGGLGMTQAQKVLRLRGDGAVPYQPATLGALPSDTVPGIPAPLSAAL